MKACTYLLWGVRLALAGSAQAQVVIVNAQSPATSLTKAQAEQIFMGKSTSMPGGGAAVPVDNAALRDTFYKNLTGKSGEQVKAHWAKLEFTGMGKAPAELADGKAVSDQVAKNPSGVGYVDKADVGGGREGRPDATVTRHTAPTGWPR